MSSLEIATPPLREHPPLLHASVIAVHSHGASHGAVARRAAELARRLSAEVVYVPLAVRLGREEVLFPQLSTLDPVARIRAEIVQRRVLARWGRWLLKHGASHRVRHAASAGALVRVAKEERSILLVVPAAWRGDRAVQLAHTTRLPVLVARRHRPGGRMIVASNLEDERYPVVRRALALARSLDVDVTLVHNARPPSSARAKELSEHRAILQQLDTLDADIALTSRGDPVAGIVDVARQTNADLIVVGAPAQGLWGRLFGAATSRRLIDQAQRSVLVLPVA